MFERIRTWVLHLAKVPPEPQPPAGSPGSIRIFRAGRNELRLRLARWGMTQAAALAGVLFSLSFLQLVRMELAQPRPAPAAVVAPAVPSPVPAPPPAPLNSGTVSPETAEAKTSGSNRRTRTRGPKRSPVEAAAEAVRRLPPWAFTLIQIAEVFGLIGFVGQLVVTLAALRLEYEQHWYIVTDRSLRIRHGLWRLQERTMSFANLQQVTVSQGPLQRLLGLADVHVESAGGGGAPAGPGKAAHADAQLHVGIFRSVDNATEIRDLIIDRLRRFREAGLGDPDDIAASSASSATDAPVATGTGDVTLQAAQAVLAEARLLRHHLVR